jgi:hypothetical protein
MSSERLSSLKVGPPVRIRLPPAASQERYLRDGDREVGLLIYRSAPSGRRRPQLALLRSQIRGSLGAAGEGQSVRPYGRAITGAVCAVFTRGCIKATLRGTPYGCTAQPTATTDARSSTGQRLSASLDTYRQQRHLQLGAFNCRVI